MYRVATALCELAAREGVAPSEPDIHLFEQLFMKSVERHGRANELRVVAASMLGPAARSRTSGRGSR